MKQVIWLAVLALPGLAGCSDSGDPPQAPGVVAPCDGFLGPKGCFRLDELRLQFRGCAQTAFTIELTAPVFDLPPGYQPSNSATSAQRVAVQWAPCASFQIPQLGLLEQNVSIGQAGVLVLPPGRGEPGSADNLYDVEVLTDSAFLRDLLLRGGFPVVNATVRLTDRDGLREVVVAGEATYRTSVAYTPEPTASAVYDEAHHREAFLYNWQRRCEIHTGSGVAVLETETGALTEAALPSGHLQGRGSQPVECEFIASFVPVGE